MSNLLYAKLAATNLSKNKSTYFPYMLTCIACILTFYIILSIYRNEGMNVIRGADTAKSVFLIGAILLGMFSVVLLFYTNSFLIKRRKKELGLYCVLGMEKRHVARVLFFETLFTAFISLALGLFLGMLFSKLMFLLLLRMLSFGTPLAFGISVSSIGTTLLLFLLIFGATLSYNLFHVRLSNPIELLHGGKKGEKEPKGSWILTLLGLLSLGCGYGIALTVGSPLKALQLFFLAAILVIAGTYFLFISGSIILLKGLRKNKKFYYKPRNFISISGMIYRMKQNAAGLASICILSSMVLVTLSTTVSLYIGRNDTSSAMYPQDYTLRIQLEEENSKAVKTVVQQTAEAMDASVQSSYDFYSQELMLGRGDGQFHAVSNEDNSASISKFNLVTLEEYNALEKTDISLNTGQALLFYNAAVKGTTYGEPTLTIGDTTLEIKKELSHFGPYNGGSLADNYYLVLKDSQEIEALYQQVTGERPPFPGYEYGFDLKGAEELDSDACFSTLTEAIAKSSIDYESYGLASKVNSDQQWLIINGSFLFLGIFFGILFLTATVLIIYYKQISEGLDDHDRFRIMQQVGMSQKEVRRTIQQQIVMVFFLPLATAVIHTFVAFPAICKLLLVFDVRNHSLFLICTIVTILIFAVFYMLIYQLTARIYYRLVERAA